AAPDGYTIGVGTSAGLAINPAIMKENLGYNAEKDFAYLHLTACLIRAKRLVESVVASSEMPVMLPPGRASESMRLVATGSPAPKATTVGTFARLQASTTG